MKKQDGTDVLYAVEPKSTEGKDASTYIVTEVPVTTGLETDFYIEVSGSNIQNGMSIVSDPQSVTPGMEVTPDLRQQDRQLRSSDFLRRARLNKWQKQLLI